MLRGAANGSQHKPVMISVRLGYNGYINIDNFLQQ